MKSWFSIQNKATASAAEILIFDEIGLWGVSSRDFAEALQAIPADRQIVVGINSPGGSVFDGLAIYNLLNMRREFVTTRVDGVAASIASVILCAGAKSIMPENAMVMIHEPSVGSGGTASQLREDAEILDKIAGQLVGIYVAKTGKPEEEIRAAISKDNWMTAKEAQAFGLCNEISSAVKVTASFDFRRFKNGPPPIRDEKPTEESPKTSNPQNTIMNKLLAALVEAKLISSATLTDEQAAAEFATNWAHIQTQLTEAETAKTKAAEAAVNAAAKDGKIKDDANTKAFWVKNYKADPTATQSQFDAMAKSTPRGIPPVPPAPTAGTGDAEAIRAEFKNLKGAERTEFFNKNRAVLLASLHTVKPS